MHTSLSYRERFQLRDDAARYDQRIYRSGTIDDLLWQVEQRLLTDIVARFRSKHPGPVAYLDFACGTGRILSHVAPLVEQATGIDVSAAMLGRAGEKAPRAQLLCKDITAAGEPIEAQYDLITSFRFLTNAEAPLRAAALQGLARRLRDERSLLAINIHANRHSYKAALAPLHWAQAKLTGAAPPQYLSVSQVTRELAAAGLRVERAIGAGFVPGKLLGLLPRAFALQMERALAGRRWLERFGVNQLFLCRKQSG